MHCLGSIKFLELNHHYPCEADQKYVPIGILDLKNRAYRNSESYRHKINYDSIETFMTVRMKQIMIGNIMTVNKNKL